MPQTPSLVVAAFHGGIAPRAAIPTAQERSGRGKEQGGGHDGTAHDSGGRHGSRGGPAGGLSRGPGLLAFGDPCADHYPAAAHARHGEVRIELRVQSDGSARPGAVLLEHPRGQGFARAARSCARRLRFSPARNRQGAAVAALARVQLSFDRD